MAETRVVTLNLVTVTVAPMGRYQNSGAKTGTLDIKLPSQVGHPLLPADILVQFDDVEGIQLGRGVFDGMGVVTSFVKRHNKKYVTL